MGKCCFFFKESCKSRNLKLEVGEKLYKRVVIIDYCYIVLYLVVECDDDREFRSSYLGTIKRLLSLYVIYFLNDDNFI